MSKVKELIEHVQLLLDDAQAYMSALELFDLDGGSWAELAAKLVEDAKKELSS